jgi:hypothetical protein
MLSFRRLAVTASLAAALAVPAASHARPIEGGPHWDDQVSASIDKASADARFVPHPDATFVSAPKTAVPETVVVEADAGFQWADAAIGGGAALLLTAVVGGAALTIRPRRASAQH